MNNDEVFTTEQVENLNRYQNSGVFHEFTCGNNHKGDRILVATNRGWNCPSCDYTQTWAHDFMLNFTDEIWKTRFGILKPVAKKEHSDVFGASTEPEGDDDDDEGADTD